MRGSGISRLCGLAAISAAMVGASSSYGAAISFDERQINEWNNNGINPTLQAIGVNNLTISGAQVYHIGNENHYYYDSGGGFQWVPRSSVGNEQGLQTVATGPELTRSLTFSFTEPFTSFSANVFCVSGYTVTAYSGGNSVYTSTLANSGLDGNGKSVHWGDIQVSGVVFDSVKVSGVSGSASADGKTVFIDNVNFVPEPTLLGAMAASSFGLLLRKRQKRA